MPAKHKLPINSVTVLGMEYRLRLVPSVQGDDGEECWGTTDTGALEILIADGPRKRVNRTICHELVHVWQDALGLDVSEDQANQFEIVLFDLFNNQPALVAMLQRSSW